MFKNKAFFVILTAIFLNFCTLNLSFATENSQSDNWYPDYACEFTGNDKCEGFNRKLFVFNLKLNKYFVKPVSIVWASVMPKYGMDRLKCAYDNVNFPKRVVSCMIQKDFHSAKTEFIRFLANTTIGIGGLYNPATTKFKIEPRDEDMEQALAHLKMKQGPYLVLPVVRGNIRTLLGKLLDCPLKPTSYVGPFGAAANAILSLNNATQSQPMVKKIDESYADPYEIARQVDGIERFIKNNNLDRSEVFAKQTANQSIIKVNKLEEATTEISLRDTTQIQPDIELKNFNAQGSMIDSLRTAYFDNQKIDSSAWSEVSIWNKTFKKRLKTTSVNLSSNRPNYNYKYILQKQKTSPLAIIYPSIGDGINSDKSVVLAKILYDTGYSVIIQGSSFSWEFVKSMPKGYAPGIPAEDAKLLRDTTGKIIANLQKKTEHKFDKRILVGCSFGALTGIFTAEQEAETNNQLGISKFIAINPPIDILFALKQIDKYSQDWKDDNSDIKMRTAIAAEKILQVSNTICNKETSCMPEELPFTTDESKIIVGFLMKQKLYDVIFAIENDKRGKKCDLPTKINKISFNTYAQKYLAVTPDTDINGTTLYSISDFLKNSNNYKIYQSLDDYFVNKGQLSWLKHNTSNNTVLFSNGSHLGEMYRKEFLEQFKKDIALTDETPTKPGL